MDLCFFSVDKNLSGAWRVTEAEMKHLDSFRCSNIYLGKFFKYFFKFLCIQRHTHTFKLIYKNSKEYVCLSTVHVQLFLCM